MEDLPEFFNEFFDFFEIFRRMAAQFIDG